MTTVHLIDASPYLFRAWFSLPKSIVDPKGRPMNAVYGFTSFLLKYLADEKPSHIGIAFDRHFNGSFRNELYAPYKAQREASPVELEAQVDPCVEVVEAMGMASFIDERYEADDLIATVIDKTRRSRADYVIVTTDKDMTQLVCDRVIVSNPGKNERYDAAAVEAKFGVKPEQITDFLGLAGDSVDNIPGVRGIGPKTAAELLRKYGSLEGIYEAVPAMQKSRVRGEISLAAKLAEHVELAGLSKRLATVAIDAPVDVTLADLAYRGPDMAKIDALFGSLGFNTLRERITH
ncbi:MAG TPA: 5'-3' exonuclease H3TH domain-containing protein [Thermoanaerobaculia bacterium]|nr:5'-3' exonuclease H3TH domain-containing protein [Thermoanaerobaculia bacterium]